MKPKDARKLAAWIAVPLALLSLTIALLIRCCEWPAKKEPLGYIIIGVWAICPPVWFFLEWVYLSKGEDRDDFKHGQELARNVWLALVVVLAAILSIKWPIGD